MPHTDSVTKLCLACGEDKPRDLFSNSKGRKDGKFPYCKACGWSPQGPKIGLEKRRAEMALARAAVVPPPNKTCSRCKQEKPRDAFHNSKCRKDGKDSYCADCQNFASREEARLAREERERLAGPKDPSKKKCPVCEQTKDLTEFYTSTFTHNGRNSHCKECIRYRAKERYKNDPSYREKMKNSRKRYYQENIERVTEAQTEWIKNNRARHCANVRRRNVKRKARPESRLENCVRSMLREAIKDGGKRAGWRSVLGYTFDELKNHLERQFTEGMSWELFRQRKIELDHTIPRSAFYYETIEDEDFKRCWALGNLQPLWRKDNRRKGDKMPDGSSGRLIGLAKKRLLDEESSVAGYETVKTASDEGSLVG